MKILVIGGGGREHSLVWKLKQSAKVKTIYCAPGNAGIKKDAVCVDLQANDIDALRDFALAESIDLTIVGPEEPLTLGIVDTFEETGLRIFGPSKAAAELEASKAFTKDFLQKYDIPSASYRSFREVDAAKKYIDTIGAPCVVKADGLAAGKGVVLAETKDQAKQAVDAMMNDRVFGDAGSVVVIEELLLGEEASFIAFVDGENVLPLPSSQDHKAVFEGDRGPNTGGMGAYSPAPVLDRKMTTRVMNEIMIPVVRGMAAEGRPYRGMLYAGLMIDGDTINVLEFNCRFGDPECQPLLMRLKSDLVDIFEHCLNGELNKLELSIDSSPSVCVVMASEGYPGKYPTGKVITGLGKAARVAGVQVFHAGTATKNRRTVTSGGRVLGVTATGQTLEKALASAYKAVEEITWTGAYFRKDIGHRALRRLNKEKAPSVGIVMGSDSDLPIMRAAADMLQTFGISSEVQIASAHRSPSLAAAYAETARARGLKVIIAGAGMAAHLAGVLAAHTTLPVIGVPIDSSSLGGLDALLSTVQMPPGIPVATMGIGKAGAKNAAVLAARIIGIEENELRKKLQNHAREMERQVAEKNKTMTT
ncbi:MAG: 5-(carboxyamino)imidazole ribonucleotide mutase [Desulfobulbus propionicus]|nr:MAG: 5-(carboxyamino)imidazole ribonucleotide mutase [Desulfobulbus propionicus]